MLRHAIAGCGVTGRHRKGRERESWRRAGWRPDRGGVFISQHDFHVERSTGDNVEDPMEARICERPEAGGGFSSSSVRNHDLVTCFRHSDS